MKVVLEAQQPLHLIREDIEELADQIRMAHPSADTHITSREQRGYAVTWWEVVRIWILEPASAALVVAFMGIAIKWARERMKRRDTDRPQYIAIYGPDGRVIKSVVLKDREGRTDDDSREPSRSIPGLP